MSDVKHPVSDVKDPDVVRAIGCRLLNGFARATGYRFRRYLSPKFEMPPDSRSIDPEEVKKKARASATVSGVLLAFSAAFLVAVLSTDLARALDILNSVTLDPRKWERLAFFQSGVPSLAGIILPVLPLLTERWVSAAKEESEDKRNHLRARRYLLLAVWIVILVVGALFVSLSPSSEKFCAGLAFSGVALIVVSLLLQVLAVEFYDTAGGFSSNIENAREYHFHMASIASHCYVLGLSTGIVGISLLICLKNVIAGCWLAVIVVLSLTAMTEIERALVRLSKHPDSCQTKRSTPAS